MGRSCVVLDTLDHVKWLLKKLTSKDQGGFKYGMRKNPSRQLGCPHLRGHDRDKRQREVVWCQPCYLFLVHVRRGDREGGREAELHGRWPRMEDTPISHLLICSRSKELPSLQSGRYPCACLCVSVCEFACVCLCVCTCPCVFVCVCMYLYMSVCIYICLCVYLCVCLCFYIYAFVFLCVCLCVSVHVSVCICVCAPVYGSVCLRQGNACERRALRPL